MGIELRMPNINGASEREQLAQVKSYLYQIIPQLQWALNNVNATGVSNQAVEQIARSISASSSASGSPINAEITFAKLKPLIIKSADIVEAYYEEINKRLEGLYVAESDFGTFIEKTEQDIKTTSTYVDQKFSDIQLIITDEVDSLNTSVTNVVNLASGLNDSVVEVKNTITETNTKVNETTIEVEGLKTATQDTTEKVDKLNSDIADANSDIEDLRAAVAAVVKANAYIRSGLLYYDSNEFPVYGLEIGQKNTINGEEVFNKFARFTSDRLSFYDNNGTEVAYISDYRLYIRNVEISSSFKIGGFVDTVTADGGIVTKWVGRG
jgi:uncharacterized coiled-coil DUF342 family protein